MRSSAFLLTLLKEPKWLTVLILSTLQLPILYVVLMIRNDLADIFGFFKDIFYHTIEIGECAAQIFIDIPIVGDMLFASVTCLISVVILAIEGLIVYFLL